MTWVVDASVAVKWVVPEALSEHAERVLATDEELLAPDLLLVEAANALWKKTERGELASAEARRALDVVLSSGLVIRPSRPLLSRALVLADRLAHPVYDCVYLALAEHERATLVTGGCAPSRDRRQEEGEDTGLRPPNGLTVTRAGGPCISVAAHRSPLTVERSPYLGLEQVPRVRLFSPVATTGRVRRRSSERSRSRGSSGGSAPHAASLRS